MNIKGVLDGGDEAEREEGADEREEVGLLIVRRAGAEEEDEGDLVRVKRELVPTRSSVREQGRVSSSERRRGSEKDELTVWLRSSFWEDRRT